MKKNNTKVIGMQVVNDSPSVQGETFSIKLDSEWLPMQKAVLIQDTVATLEMFNSLAVKADTSMSGIDKVLANVGWWIFSLPKIIKAIREIVNEYKNFRDSLRAKYSDDDIKAIFKQLESFESDLYSSSKMEKVSKEGV